MTAKMWHISTVLVPSRYKTWAKSTPPNVTWAGARLLVEFMHCVASRKRYIGFVGINNRLAMLTRVKLQSLTLGPVTSKTVFTLNLPKGQGIAKLLILNCNALVLRPVSTSLVLFFYAPCLKVKKIGNVLVMYKHKTNLVNNYTPSSTLPTNSADGHKPNGDGNSGSDVNGDSDVGMRMRRRLH